MPDSPPTKAQLAGLRRAAQRAADEAAALRANLHRRKAQTRAREAAVNPPAPQQPDKPCP
jgi:hypothetical protein